MAVNPIIAQGTQPFDVSNTLLSLARLNLAKNEEERRAKYDNAVLTRMNRAAMRERMGREKVEEVEGKKQALAWAQWISESETPAELYRQNPVAMKALEELKVDPGSLDDETARRLAQGAVMRLSADLGIGPPQDEKPKLGSVNPNEYTPESLAKFQQSGNMADLRRVPPQYAPRQPTEFELYQRDPAAYEQYKRVGQSGNPPRPQVVTDPLGGDPYAVVEGPNGQLVRRPIPVEGQPGPTKARAAAEGKAPIVKVQTVEEALALPPGTLFETPDGRVKVRP